MHRAVTVSLGFIFAFVSMLASCAGTPTATPPCTPPPNDVLLTSNISLELIGSAAKEFEASVRAGIQPNVTDLVGQGARHDLIRQYIRCLMQKEMNLLPGQIAWYESCERFFATKPSPGEAAEFLAMHPFPGASAFPKLPFELNVQLATGPDDANLIASKDSDWEVDSDDWTGVDVSYTLRLTNDNRSVVCDLVWNVKELERDGSYKGKTHIQSKRTFVVYDLPQLPGVQAWEVEIVESASGNHSEQVPDKRHNLVRLRDFGALTGVQVQFDGPEGNDKDRQILLATLRARLRLVKRT